MQRRMKWFQLFLASTASIVLAFAFAASTPASAQESREWLFKNSFNPTQCQGDLPKSTPDALESQIAAQQGRIDDLKNQIKRIGFDKRADDFKAWDDLAEKSKNEFHQKTLDLVMDQVKQGAEDQAMKGLQKGLGKALDSKAVARLKSLNPFNDDKLINELRKKGFSNKTLEDAIKGIANTKGKPKMLADAKDAVSHLDEYKDGWDKLKEAKEAVAKFATGNKLEASKATLELFVNDPTLKLLISDVEFASASLYNNAVQNVAANEVERLTDMNEDGLLTLKRLQCSMEKAVKTKNAAQRKLDNLEAPQPKLQPKPTPPPPTAPPSSGGPGLGTALAVSGVVGAAAVGGAYYYQQNKAASCTAPDINSGSAAAVQCGSSGTLSGLNFRSSSCSAFVAAEDAYCKCAGYSGFNINYDIYSGGIPCK